MIDKTDGRQYRSFNLLSEGNKIEGYAVVFEQKTVIAKDSYTGADFYEVIGRGALDSCDLSDVVLNVDHQGAPIARTRAGTLALTIDEHGLKISATLTTTRGREVWEDVKAGNLDKMSFAFSVDEEEYDKATRTRTIRKIGRLWDVSVVTFPAYEQTSAIARASMSAHMEEEQKCYVDERLTKIRGRKVPELPEMRTGDQWAGLEIDLAELKKLKDQAEELKQWEPEGDPEDVNAVNEKTEKLEEIIQEIEAATESVRKKAETLERGAQFYGWEPLQTAPTSKSEVEALARRGVELKLINGIPYELLEYYDSINPKYGYAKRTKTNFTIKGEKTMNDNIEIRALQSYICKGTSQMTEDEKRALTTTGSGAAVIPTEIADRIISNAGYSILTHRAARFADGRRGKLVIPVAPVSGGAGWHAELETVTPHDQSLAAITLEGGELVKIIAASKTMTAMAVDSFVDYLVNLLSGELLDTLESSYITGVKGTDNCPGDGLDTLDFTGRTVTATNAITIPDIAKAVSLLPSKAQAGALVMGNAATLAGILTSQGNYAFDVRTTMKDMGIELVQNPYVADDVLYVIADPKMSMFLNFWQPISVKVSEDAMFMQVATAIGAVAVVGFSWVPWYTTKVVVGA